MNEPATHFDAQPTVSNHFAWMRTEMALHNTLMAGVRTSVSLIGFGFTVAQFFERVQTKGPVVAINAPRNLGLTLIAAGVVLIAIFIWQYRRTSRYLWSESYRVLSGSDHRPLHAGPNFAAWVVLLIGVAAFLSVLMHF